MKLAPCLVAAIAAQSGDDADRWDNTDFTLTDNIFTYEQPKDTERYDGGACTTTLVIQAVTCWESNNMGNLDHYVTQNDDGFGWNNIHHGHDQGGHSSATTGTGAGTQESTNYGKNVPSTSPKYQIGTYARGMMNDNGTALNRIDYHSAMAFDNRYSGCIYEAADWNYTASTYNQMFRMSYGYDPRKVDGATANIYLNDASGVDLSNLQMPIRPNWWHYFNAHILNVGMFDNNFDTYGRHLLVMANPAYEGLGYLNWITTFAKQNPENGSLSTSVTGDHGNWNEFMKTSTDQQTQTTGYNADITDADYTAGRYRGELNHNTHDTVTDLYSGGYAFHLGSNCPTTVVTAGQTFTTVTTTDYAGNAASAYNIPANQNLYMNPNLDVHSGAALANNRHNAAPADESGLATAGNFFNIGSGYDPTTAAERYQPKATGAGETNEWYSYLIMRGSVAMLDTNLDQMAADANKTLYPWVSMAAVSSFPHNDLGQDFRFNIRILHYGGRGFPYFFGGQAATSALTTSATPGALNPGGAITVGSTDFSIMNPNIQYLAQDSYYWYKVNTVMIDFPSYVRCPRYRKNVPSDRLPYDAMGRSNSSGTPYTEAQYTAAFKDTDETNYAGATSEFTANSIGDRIADDELLEDTFRCMDSGNFNGHRGWNSATPYAHDTADTYNNSLYFGHSSTDHHMPSENRPFYIETLSELNGAPYRGIRVSEDLNNDGTADDPLYDNARGFICGPEPPFNGGVAGDLTGVTGYYRGEWYKCGQRYKVHGLMNTYDEHAQLEYGTMQEIWFQFWYHYVINYDLKDVANATNQTGFNKRNSNTARDDKPAAFPHVAGKHGDVQFSMANYANNYLGGTNTITTYDHLHNFPNILFNAFELRGIRFFCDDINSFNSNQCFHAGTDYGTSYTAATMLGDAMTNP